MLLWFCFNEINPKLSKVKGKFKLKLIRLLGLLQKQKQGIQLEKVMHAS